MFDIKDIAALEKGKVYAIQAEKPLSHLEIDAIRGSMEHINKKHNIDIIVLDSDLRLISAPDGFEVTKKGSNVNSKKV